MSTAYRPVASATVAVLDQLDPLGAWAVRDGVVRLCETLGNGVQRTALANLLHEIAEAVSRINQAA